MELSRFILIRKIAI